jgi:hypothetical protein
MHRHQSTQAKVINSADFAQRPHNSQSSIKNDENEDSVAKDHGETDFYNEKAYANE